MYKAIFIVKLKKNSKNQFQAHNPWFSRKHKIGLRGKFLEGVKDAWYKC